MTDLLTPEQATSLLDQFFAQHLPITQYLNMRCHRYDGEVFSLAIDLAPSLNDKLTAFGGSLYCACVMNGWGLIYLQARQRGVKPNMVVTRGEIDYLAPVTDEPIIATAVSPLEIVWDEAIARVKDRGKQRFGVTSSISSGGREAVRFKGEYAIIGAAD